MKEIFLVDDIQTFLKKSELKPTILLLGAPLLVTFHRYLGNFSSGNIDIPAIHPALLMFISAFFMFGLIPLLIIKLIFKESIVEYGVRPGDWRFGLKSVLAFSPMICLLLLYPGAQTEEMRLFYPLDHSLQILSPKFFLFQLWRGIFFYTAWEFFFRGFLLFGLRRYVGDWMAICIQTIPQCLWHIGMPSGEIISSIAGGVLFGLLALRTGSIFWPFLLHLFIGISTDILIIIT
ncbi:MAG: CPBP family intramembrane metalloprotease [Calditrichales bacterium]|nr:MAG: CPBP family intramembrane metalloprotease [Calditrichales bacterium]